MVREFLGAIMLMTAWGDQVLAMTGFDLDVQDRAKRTIGQTQALDLPVYGMNSVFSEPICQLWRESDQIKQALENMEAVECQGVEEQRDSKSVQRRLDLVLEARNELFLKRERLNSVILRFVQELRGDFNARELSWGFVKDREQKQEAVCTPSSQKEESCAFENLVQSTRRNIEILEGLWSMHTFLYDLLAKFGADEMLYKLLPEYKTATPSEMFLWSEMLDSYKVSLPKQARIAELMYKEKPQLSLELGFYKEKLKTYELEMEDAATRQQ